MEEVTVVRLMAEERQRLRRLLAAAFLFSGLPHEMAISLPVRAGFGLPLLYFAPHGGLMPIERVLSPRGRVWLARLARLAAADPLPPPFLRGIVWPPIGIGA